MENNNKENKSKENTSADDIIKKHIQFSMVAGAIPVPLVDIAAVTAVQVDMLKQLAQEYKVDYSHEKGKSLVSSIMGAIIGSKLGKTGASLVKTIPGLGTILGIGSQVLLSGASTYAIGKIFQNHFGSQGTLLDFSVEGTKKNFKELLDKGKNYVKKINNSDDDQMTISKLEELKKKKIISEEEFEKIKKKIEEDKKS